MSIQVLHRVAKGPFPLHVEGPDVAAIESLLEGGLIEATLDLHREGVGTDRATVHRITALGTLHLRSFPGR